jgi:hypothetical protein
MRGKEAAEESIARRAAATGGLRSGATIGDLTGLSAQLEQRAFSEYTGGLGGLAQLQTRPEEISRGMSSIAETMASGQIAGAQAQQQGAGNLASLGMTALMAFSDRRLKKDIEKVGEAKGLPWYKWVWNKEAENLGLNGEGYGFMADEVESKYPEHVEKSDGYTVVDYGSLLYGS